MKLVNTTTTTATLATETPIIRPIFED